MDISEKLKEDRRKFYFMCRERGYNHKEAINEMFKIYTEEVMKMKGEIINE